MTDVSLPLQPAPAEPPAARARMMERVLRHMPVVFARFDAQGRYLEHLGGAQRPFGVADNALVGRSLTDMFPNMRVPLSELLGGQAFTFNAPLPAGGGERHFLCYGYLDGLEHCAVLLAVDVTDAEQVRQRLGQAEDFARTLLHHSHDGIMAFDAAGCVTAWSGAMHQFSGHTAAAMTGRPLRELPLFGPDKPLGRALAAVLGSAPAMQRLSFAGVYRPGTHYDAVLAPLPGGGGMAVVRDVTELHRQAAEEARQERRRQREVLAAVLHTQETERKRIAEALHNGLGQLLYATKLSLESHSTDNAPPREALALLEEAIRATRTLSFELTPGVLEDFGLHTALQELMKRIPAQLPVALHVQGLAHRLPEAVEMAAYRIVQELLNNVLKHAQATECLVYVVCAEHQLHLAVEDNGVGLDRDRLTTDPLGGLGLPSIRNRVDLLNGTFSLDDRPGHGTIASVMLPVNG